jgi:hypothetical protein
MFIKEQQKQITKIICSNGSFNTKNWWGDRKYVLNCALWFKAMQNRNEH